MRKNIKLMKEIKEELNKERYSMFMDKKAQYCQDLRTFQLGLRFNAIPIKVLSSYFINFDKLVLKFIWKGKGLRIVNTNPEGEEQLRRLTLPNFKT